MSLAVGTRLGPYEIIGLLGAGGMGEVFRARDTKLNRDVALKVLPDSFANDAERLARFTREAQTLASLNHPNIAAIYGLEESGGVRALVMELVEGEDLSQRIARGAIPFDEAMPIAKQIAEALEAAHEQGIIHRDLKPANIKVRPDGTVKVLDFGLAKALEPASGTHIDATASPTITSPAMMTGVGMLLGTAAYMSPEQARGKAVDKRSDIWAFGCVLSEMLTGKRAFEDEDISMTLSKVLQREPDFSLLPSNTPLHVRQTVRLCLRKSLKERVPDIGAVRLALEGAFETAGTHASQSGAVALPIWRRPLIVAAASALVGATLAVVIQGMLPRPAAGAAPRVARLTIAISAGGLLADFPSVAVSPAGTHVAYAAGSTSQWRLYLRAIDNINASPLAGTESAVSPFFSPDGQWIGFFAAGKLKKVSVATGITQTLCDAPFGGGGSWGADGTIHFAATNISGISRVSADGGTPTDVTRLDRARGEVSHRWPQVLPGGGAVLFTVWKGPGNDEKEVHVQRLDTGERTAVIPGAESGRYVSTGHVVYARADALLAMPFDLDRLRVSGEAVRLFDVVRGMGSTGEGADYAVSDTGVAVYPPGDPLRYERRLVWVDRNGRVEPLPAPPRFYNGNAALSPDGRLAAVDIEAGTIGIWVYNLSRGTLTPLATGGGSSQAPRWTPDGQRIVYRGTRAGFRNVWSKSVDDATGEARLTTGETLETPGSWSSDGQWLVYLRTDPATGFDVWALPAGGDRKQRVIINSSFDESDPRVSPDSHWLAYASTESGRKEVFVQPFPDGGRRIQISTDGGAEPVWSRDGRELFYVSGNRMMVADIRTAPTFAVGMPRALFEGRFIPNPNDVATYDVAADGRFLMVQPLHPDPPANQIQVVLNWFEELKRLVPV